MQVEWFPGDASMCDGAALARRHSFTLSSKSNLTTRARCVSMRARASPFAKPIMRRHRVRLAHLQVAGEQGDRMSDRPRPHRLRFSGKGKIASVRPHVRAARPGCTSAPNCTTGVARLMRGA